MTCVVVVYVINVELGNNNIEFILVFELYLKLEKIRIYIRKPSPRELYRKRGFVGYIYIKTDILFYQIEVFKNRNGILWFGILNIW